MLKDAKNPDVFAERIFRKIPRDHLCDNQKLKHWKKVAKFLYVKIHGQVREAELKSSFSREVRSMNILYAQRYVAEKTQPLREELQNPEHLQEMRDRLGKVLSDTAEFQVKLPNDKMISVPVQVELDYNRGIPASVLVYEDTETSLDEIPSDSMTPIDRIPKAMAFIEGLYRFSHEHAQKTGMSPTLEKALFRNLLILHTQTIRNASGPLLHTVIDPNETFKFFSGLSPKFEKVRVEWNKDVGHFEAFIDQTYSLDYVGEHDPGSTGTILKITTSFSLTPRGDDWEWSEARYSREDIQLL